jgi:hypothetical protein
LFSLKLET